MHQRQKRAIQLLSAGSTVSECAQEINVSRNTVYRWFNDSDFSSELQNKIDQINRVSEREFLSLKPRVVQAYSDSLYDFERALPAAKAYFQRIDRINELLLKRQEVEFQRAAYEAVTELPKLKGGQVDFKALRQEFEQDKHRFDAVVGDPLPIMREHDQMRQNATECDSCEDN